MFLYGSVFLWLLVLFSIHPSLDLSKAVFNPALLFLPFAFKTDGFIFYYDEFRTLAD